MSLPDILIRSSSWDPDVPGLGSAPPSGCSPCEVLPLDLALLVHPPRHLPSERGRKGEGAGESTRKGEGAGESTRKGEGAGESTRKGEGAGESTSIKGSEG